MSEPQPSRRQKRSKSPSPQKLEPKSKKPAGPKKDKEYAHSSDEEINMDPDPLYDPDMDQKDETWVQKRLMGEKASTDAVLNCPACFQSLCHDCQKHDKYQQYRAMFVDNCKVCDKEPVRPVVGDDDDEMGYFNVRCDNCDCHVGVVDSDEVYHFFNVLATSG